MATRFKNVDEIQSSNTSVNPIKLDYSFKAVNHSSGVSTVDLNTGHNFSIDMTGNTDLVFSNTLGRSGQSGSLYITNGTPVTLGDGNVNVVSTGDFNGENIVSYLVVSDTKVALSIGGSLS